MKVIFTGCSEEQKRFGYHTGDPNELEVGKVYEVRKEEEHTWHTKYYLKGFEGSFNSICFADWHDGWENNR